MPSASSVGRALSSRALVDGPRHAGPRQRRQQLARAGQRADLPGLPGVGLGVALQQPGGFLGGDGVPSLAQDGVGHQPAAHAYAAVDAPDRQLDTAGLQRLAPGQDVLVDTVHQCAVQVEQKRRARRAAGFRAGHAVPPILRPNLESLMPQGGTRDYENGA
jgi:hypothetical protein